MTASHLAGRPMEQSDHSAGKGPGCIGEATMVPIASLRIGESPRLEGEDKAHVARLAAVEAPLPPVLVHRRTMRVIDGMHRILAASLNGRETIDAEFFEGSLADAFLLAVEANVTHGLPLSYADRRAAAERITKSHPQMSDRAIATSVGLSAGAVAGIRRRSASAVPQPNARVGRDGRVRPLSSAEGRLRAASFITDQPEATLREIARASGVSPGTALDVRRRLESGEDPVPGSPAQRNRSTSAVRRPAKRESSRQGPETSAPSPAFALEKLMRDPSLRHNERGRQLLMIFHHNAISAQEWSDITAAVPPHCAALAMQVARHLAQMWLEFASSLGEHTKVSELRLFDQAGGAGA